MPAKSLNIEAVRAHFPAFQQIDAGQTPVFLDNPAGTQVPQAVIDAVSNYFIHSNAGLGGAFATSRRTEAMMSSARQTVAAFLNAPQPETIVFGPNMTTLTLAFSRAVGQTLQPGDEIILSQMDHDANIAPWLLMARDKGVTVRWIRLDVEDGTLDLASYQAALNEKTRWVCVVQAANALGTINPIKEMATLAHAAGARIFVDAVQAAPHLLLDVQDLDVDVLVCSAYKFYGPHIGILYGKIDLLDSLTPYKVRPAADYAPRKWETGMPSYETIAGTEAAINYLASLGEGESLRARLISAYDSLIPHENALIWRLIDGLLAMPDVEIRGITDSARASERVPTVVFRLAGHTPLAVAQHLAAQGIYVWSGNYYAMETMQAFGYEEGMVRIGIAHYNSVQDIERVLAAIAALTR